MVANDAFFQRRQAAAVLKHAIVHRYSQVFASMAGSRSGRLVYFDGYAGPGLYDDGTRGSPLLAVDTAKRAASWGRSMELVFTEVNPRYAQQLQATLEAEAPQELSWKVWAGDVAQHVDAALALAGRDAMLTFLDPFGTALDYRTLTTKLLGRPHDVPNEVLLNLNLEMVWRIGGLLVGEEAENESSNSLTLGRLDGFFGDTWWRDVFREARTDSGPGSAARAADQVATEFQHRVEQATGYKAFPVPIRRRPLHYPLFHLLLFTRYQYAPWKFNDAVSSANGEWREACWEQDLQGQIADFSDDDLFGGTMAPTLLRDESFTTWQRQQRDLDKAWVADIMNNLSQLLAAGQPVQLGKVTADVYGSTLGLAREKHVRQAWDQLAVGHGATVRDKSVKRLEQAWIAPYAR